MTSEEAVANIGKIVRYTGTFVPEGEYFLLDISQLHVPGHAGKIPWVQERIEYNKEHFAVLESKDGSNTTIYIQFKDIEAIP